MNRARYRELKPLDVDVDYGDQIYFGDKFPTTRLARFCIDKVADWMREEHPMLHEAFHAHHHLFRGPVEDASRVLPVFEPRHYYLELWLRSILIAKNKIKNLIFAY